MVDVVPLTTRAATIAKQTKQLILLINSPVVFVNLSS